MRTLLATSIVAAALLLLGAVPSSAKSHFAAMGIIPHDRVIGRAAAQSGALSCDTISCDSYEAGLDQYFTDVAHDSGGSQNVYSVDPQYGAAYNSTFGGAYVDTNPYPVSGCTNASMPCLSQFQLVAEIENDITANGWSNGATKLFVIVLPDGVDTCFQGGFGCASNAFCGYHDSDTFSGADLIYAVVPLLAQSACYAGSAQGEPNGAEVDLSINVISHEQNEAITDPLTRSDPGWRSTYNEEADLCAGAFGAPLGTVNGQPYNQVINGHDYSIQEEYSNADAGCVQYLGGTPTHPTTDHGTHADAGPLVAYGGPVMTTNTTYAIYWVPPAPASATAPVVTGADGVGQQLATTNGTWKNSPSSFSYKWQRCGSTGLNCVDIANATSSSYTLVSADAGHEIRSEVLASNAAGPAAGGYVPSAVTGVVVVKPAVITAPKLSGTAKVGNPLAVSKGSWKHSPTGYTYQWLRCTSAGLSCKKIVAATKSSYLLTSADAGHKLEANVTASNPAGSKTAMSGKSGTVKT